jgi:hypothetical protein
LKTSKCFESPLKSKKKYQVYSFSTEKWAAEIAPDGLTTSPYSRVVSPSEVAGLTASLCIVHGLTTNTFNGQNLKLKVAVASMTV